MPRSRPPWPTPSTLSGDASWPPWSVLPATGTWPRSARRMPSPPRWSAGPATASRGAPAPGSRRWPGTGHSIGCAGTGSARPRSEEVAVLAGRSGRGRVSGGRWRPDRGGPRRSPPPHLHLLPSCVGLRGTCRADLAHAGRHDDGRDRPRLPRSRTDHGPTARPGQAQDPQRRHPLRRPARPPVARAHRGGAGRHLPALQRGVHGQLGQRPGAAVTQRRGHPLGPHPLHVDARRARGPRVCLRSCCSTTPAVRPGSTPPAT